MTMESVVRGCSGRPLFLLLGACLWCKAPVILAQEADSAVTDAIITGSQVESAQRDALERQQLPDLPARDAEEGPYILIKEPIFNVTLRTGLSYSDNPSTTATNPESDASHSYLFDTGVDTRIRGFEVGAHVYVGKNTYTDLKDLSSTYAAGFAYIGNHLFDTPHYLRLQVDRGSNYDEDFDNSSPYYSARLSWSRGVQLRPVFNKFAPQLTPSLSVTRYDYRDDPQDYAAYSAAVSFAQRLTNELSGNLNLSWTKRSYDNFFESSTGVSRSDDYVSVSMNLSYAITERLTLSVSASRNDNRSTLDTSEYDAINLGANLGFRAAF